MAADTTLPTGTTDEATPRRNAHDLAEASIHLDNAVISARAVAQHLAESWAVINRQLGYRLLDLIVDEEGFRLDDRELEAMGGEFAEGNLIDAALRRRWVLTGGIDQAIRETVGYPGILASIHKATVR